MRHPLTTTNGSQVRSHEIDYRITGSDLQMVQVTLDPGETVVAEAGSLVYMDDGVRFDTRLGDGSSTGGFSAVARALGRTLGGEDLFMSHFTNRAVGRKSVGFASPVPGKIVPLRLGDLGPVVCQKGAFLCAALGTRISAHVNRKLGSGWFGGEGFVLQKLAGDGLALIAAGGVVEEQRLTGETIRIDTGCLVAFQEGMDYSIGRAGTLKSMMFGKEGIFLATVTGHGSVWVQSLPFQRLVASISDVGSDR